MEKERLEREIKKRVNRLKYLGRMGIGNRNNTVKEMRGKKKGKIRERKRKHRIGEAGFWILYFLYFQ